MLISLALGVSLLTGCAERVSDRLVFSAYCPPIVEYSQEYNIQLADELDTLPETVINVPEVVADYISLRDKIRGCEKLKAETLGEQK